MATNAKYAQLQAFTLFGSGASLGDTSVVLSSFQTIDGVNLAMTDFGSKGYITLEPNAGTQEEQISFTGVTQNANGTATLTGVSTVLFISPYTETSGLAKDHAGGVQVVVSNTSGFYNRFASKVDNETITEVWTFSSTPLISNDPVLNLEAANKEYVDNVVVAGAPNANTTTKGIVQLATGAQLAAGTAVGSTGANLVPANSSFINVSSGAGDVNKVAVLGASGTIAQGFLNSNRTIGAVYSFTAANAQITTSPSAGNDATNKTYVDASVTAGASTATSGAAISVGDAVYFKASDGRLYRTDTSADESTYSFAGFALDAAGAGGITIRYVTIGKVATGLAGLTAGSYYFLSSTPGALSVTPDSTRPAKVAQALTTTTVRVVEPTFVRRGVQSVTAVTTYVQTTGFYPVHIDILAAPNGGGVGGSSVGDDTNNCIEMQMLGANNDAIANSSKAWICYDKNGTTDQNSGSVTNKTQTGFTLNAAVHVQDAWVQWVAWST